MATIPAATPPRRQSSKYRMLLLPYRTDSSRQPRPRRRRWHRSSALRWSAFAVPLLGLIVWLAGGRRVDAQTKQETGKQLLEQALEALGGDAFLRARTLHQVGRAYAFYHENLRGLAVMNLYQQFEPMPESHEAGWLPISRREVYTEEGDYYSLYQNGKGWEVTYQGARPLPEDRQARYRDSARRDIFFMLRYRLNEEGMYFYHKGLEIVDNTPTDAVEVFDAEGLGVTFNFRRSDHFPVRQSYQQRDAQSGIPEEVREIFSRYKTTDGVTLPWNLRVERDGEKVFEFFGRSAVINGKLPPNTFGLGGIKILSPKP
jgi:hypothetical protein